MASPQRPLPSVCDLSQRAPFFTPIEMRKVVAAMRERFTQKAFTLIELLVVIAIISIIAAILFPVFAKVREKARQTTCASNIKQISLGIMQYIQDNDEVVPPVEYTLDDAVYPDDYFTWARLTQPYVKSWSIFRCPDTELNPRNAWPSGNPYTLQ